MIYFIEAGGMVKIGYSRNITNRIHTVATACPFRCTLVGVIEGGRGDEKSVHAMFSHLHSHGEWFVFSEEVNRFLSANAVHVPLPEYSLARRDRSVFNSRLAVWRKTKSLSQDEFAVKIGVTRWMVNSIETGRRKPSLGLALKIQDLTKIDPSELVVQDATAVKSQAVEAIQ